MMTATATLEMVVMEAMEASVVALMEASAAVVALLTSQASQTVA